MKQKSIALTARQWEELETEAAKAGISVSEYLRRVLDYTRTSRARLSSDAPAG